MRIVEMVRNDIKNSSLLKTKFLIYAFNGRTYLIIRARERKRRGDGKVRIKFNKRFLRQKAKISP